MTDLISLIHPFTHPLIHNPIRFDLFFSKNESQNHVLCLINVFCIGKPSPSVHPWSGLPFDKLLLMPCGIFAD